MLEAALVCGGGVLAAELYLRRMRARLAPDAPDEQGAVGATRERAAHEVAPAPGAPGA